MSVFFKILAASPRLTIMVFMLIFSAISGGLVHRSASAETSSNPWSKNHTTSTFSAQSSKSSSSSRANDRSSSDSFEASERMRDEEFRRQKLREWREASEGNGASTQSNGGN